MKSSQNRELNELNKNDYNDTFQIKNGMQEL
jgi:hypothetical protein